LPLPPLPPPATRIMALSFWYGNRYSISFQYLSSIV
jgi:hypothetical protein